MSLLTGILYQKNLLFAPVICLSITLTKYVNATGLLKCIGDALKIVCVEGSIDQDSVLGLSNMPILV